MPCMRMILSDDMKIIRFDILNESHNIFLTFFQIHITDENLPEIKSILKSFFQNFELYNFDFIKLQFTNKPAIFFS